MCQQGCASYRGSRGGTAALPSPSSRGCLHPWPEAPFHLQSNHISPNSTSILTSPLTLTLMFFFSIFFYMDAVI